MSAFFAMSRGTNFVMCSLGSSRITARQMGKFGEYYGRWPLGGSILGLRTCQRRWIPRRGTVDWLGDAGWEAVCEGEVLDALYESKACDKMVPPRR